MARRKADARPGRPDPLNLLEFDQGRGSATPVAPSDSDFDVAVVSADSQVVVAVRGQVDLATAPLLWRCLEELIPTTKDRLVLDLPDTTFIDSSALVVFVRAFKRLRHAGADLVLRSPSRTARTVFSITGLDKVMTIEG